jgi:hypothetical protein
VEPACGVQQRLQRPMDACIHAYDMFPSEVDAIEMLAHLLVDESLVDRARSALWVLYYLD